MLVEPTIKIGKQGFNVDLPSPNANYTTVTYALCVALYNVQEIIHGPRDDSKQENSIEQLPAPEPVDARTRGNQAVSNAG